MKALVIYDSLYGNTEKVARALASGMREGGIDVECVRANTVDVGTLRAYDMIVIGGPTHSMGLSDTMKTFTKQLKEAAVKNKQAFAFDTKYDSRFAGSAGKKIEQRMKQNGMKVVVPHASAIVLGKEGPLKEGTEAQFKQIGTELARSALAS
ncbi:MAG: flavodoxin family protein [Euryarchaeota archaeon]|nr:flavodoxin family protein [Euryarchaeota archaeon]